MNQTLRLIEGNNAARVRNPVDKRIRDFLVGDADGSELFAALYSHVGREPIPEPLCLASLESTQDGVPALAKLA
jgi:hypothetical protein